MDKTLHIISSGKQRPETLITIIEKIHSYVDYIHLRERQWTARDYLYVIDTLQMKNVPLEKLMINDRVDIAHVTDVHGVQLAHHSLDVATVRQEFPHLKIGCSVQSVDQAKEAERMGAHWLIHGHIFPTASKKDLPPRGLSSLEKIVKNVQVPVIAIGGMIPEKIPKVIQAGASGVAVLSGILLVDHPIEAAKQYRQALND